MFSKLNIVLASLGITVLALGAFAPVVNADSTVTVTGDTSAGENEPGWLFNRDTLTSTPYEFNQDEASIGSGSLYVLPIGADASDKFIAENFILTPIADTNSISYDFLIGSGGNVSDANEFYMNVYANFGSSDPEKFYDCRYDVVPTSGSLDDFTTVTFDPTLSYPVTTRSGDSAAPHVCPAVPSDMDDLSAGSSIRVFSLNVGDTTANDEGLDGYLDNVIVDTNTDVTTYDFEPATVTSKEDCKKGGWKTSNTTEYKNQGDCVSSFASEGRAGGNPISNFFLGLLN